MDARLRELAGAHIRAYIKHYRATVQHSFANTPPLFFTGFPFHAHCYLLTNGAVCCGFKYSMAEFKLEFFECDFATFKSKYENEGYDYFLGFLPLHQFGEEAAAIAAQQNAIRDVYAEMHHTRLLDMIEQIDGALAKIGLLSQSKPEAKKHLKPVAQAFVDQRAIVEKLISRVEELDKGLLACFERDLLDVVVSRGDPRVTPSPQHNIAEIAQYLGLYLQNYRRGVEEYISKGLYSVRPKFYDGFPHYFQGCLMPNHASIVFVQFGMQYPSIEVNKESFESVVELRGQAKYNYMLAFGPHKNFDPDIAIEDARLAVVRDLDSVQCINVYGLIERAQEMENVSLELPEDLKLRDVENLIMAWLGNTEQIKGIYAEMLERENAGLIERWEDAYDYVTAITPTKFLAVERINFDEPSETKKKEKEAEQSPQGSSQQPYRPAEATQEEPQDIGVKWTFSKDGQPMSPQYPSMPKQDSTRALEEASRTMDRTVGDRTPQSPPQRAPSEVTLPGGIKIQPTQGAIKISSDAPVPEYRLPTYQPPVRRGYGENKFEDMIMTSKLFEEDDKKYKGKLLGPDHERKRNPSLAVFAFILLLMGALMFFAGYQMNNTNTDNATATACMMVVPDQNMYINGGALFLLVGTLCLVAYIMYKQPA